MYTYRTTKSKRFQEGSILVSLDKKLIGFIRYNEKNVLASGWFFGNLGDNSPKRFNGYFPTIEDCKKNLEENLDYGEF